MILNSVIEDLLTINNLKIDDVLSILHTIDKKIIDYADFYFQSRYHETWTIENNTIKHGTYDVDQGVGIRIIQNEKTGFSYTNQLTTQSLKHNAQIAKNILKDIKKEEHNQFLYYPQKKVTQPISIYSTDNPLNIFSADEKIELLTRVNKIARETNRYVEEVIANLSGSYEQILIIATDGTIAADIRPLVRLSINVQVERNGKREQGHSGGGGRHGYNFFLNKTKTGRMYIDDWTINAVKIAITNLSSIEAPAGSFPTVLGNGWPGILLHEAVGHGLEGDFNRRCTSIFSNKIGNKVASELCTVIDDGTLNNSRGSINIDDEGTSSQYNILIENGILKKYMQDKLNAKLMNVSPTGNARRESYAYLPMPRMTNTYMLSGQSTFEEIIDSVDYGIYASNFSGGQVDITSGKFVFSTSEAYLIEKGRITHPIKGATLIGSGIEIMEQISMVGNNLILDSGIGTCIKNGQSIPVNVGQPTIKLNKITIGGTI